jgi:hypothetical protein
MRIVRFGLLGLLFAGVMLEAQSSSDTKMIDKVKQLSVASVDPSLPDQTLEKFLQTEAGANAEFYWEVNDCAPPPGVQKQKGSAVCVEAQAQLPDQRGIVVRIKVGSSKKSNSDKPEFYSADLITPGETLQLKKLSDLPAGLAKTNRPQNPEQ